MNKNEATKDQAAALIAKHADTKLPVVKRLVTEARNAFRTGDYVKAMKRLSDEHIAREQAIYEIYG